MRFLFLTCILIASSLSAKAHQTIEVVQSFAIATTAGMANGAAYVSVENTGPSEATLLGVSGDLAEFVELHTHITDGELRRMVAIELPLILAPGEQLIMKPGGVHVMLLGLHQGMDAGDDLALTLHFDGRHVKDLEVVVPVYSFEEAQSFLGEAGGMGMSHSNMDMDHSEMDMDHSDHANHDNMGTMKPDDMETHHTDDKAM